MGVSVAVAVLAMIVLPVPAIVPPVQSKLWVTVRLPEPASVPPVRLRIWGPEACFSRMEFRTERVSYDVMPPSAARNILQAIFWKPEMRWRVREVAVLNPIRHFSTMRNEINSIQSERTARSWNGTDGGYYADADRAQRHMLGLRDVAYVITAELLLAPHATDHPAKYRDQFMRRARRGQCRHQPYLGTREFSGFFELASGDERPQPLDVDLGLMLHDMLYEDDEKGQIRYVSHGDEGPRLTSGSAQPRFFHARLEQGVLRVPDDTYQMYGGHR